MKVADKLILPNEAVTQTFGVLAVRGSGKTNACRVMAEEFYDAKLPFVAIDPVGSWWGLRSARDGKHPGLSIPIFGGKHGDVPLERGGGAVLADLIAEQRVSCVVDVSQFDSEAAKKQFLLDFAKRLYQKNEAPLHLFLEESDDYIPQRPMRDEAQLLRAWENIVRRGRARGLGITCITQRSASLNKNVLTQIETLIALRTTSPQDRHAIEEWLKYNAQSREILESLPSLADGEAWVWSPNFLKVTKRVKFRLSRTFDSGETPKSGKKAAATLADVDLDAIQKKMSTTIERAKADDPKELKKRIAELENALKKQSPTVVTERVEVPILDEKKLDAVADACSKVLNNARIELVSAIATIERELGNYRISCRDAASKPSKAKREPISTRVHHVQYETLSKSNGRANGSSDLKTMHRAMLTALAQHPQGLTKRQVLIHTGYASSGPVSTAFADLARAGYVESRGNRLAITAGGLSALGAFKPLPLGDDLRDWLLSGNKLSTMEKALLTEICNAYPDTVKKGQVLERAGYASSGPVSSAFAKLVAYGYARPEGSATLRAAEELFS